MRLEPNHSRTGPRYPAVLRRPLVAGAVTLAVSAAALLLPSVADTASATTQTGGADIAYQGDDGRLRTVTSDGIIHPVNLQMSPGTSPDLVQGPNGGDWTAVQANTGVLWTVDFLLQGNPEKARLAPGTSPSISLTELSPLPHISYRSSAGLYGVIANPGADPSESEATQNGSPDDSPYGGADDSYVTASGLVSSTNLEFDFQINNPCRAANPECLVAPGTSLAMARGRTGGPLPTRGFLPKVDTFKAAWRNPDGFLRIAEMSLANPQLGTEDFQDLTNMFPAVVKEPFNTSLQMMPGTSPAIALGLDKKFEVAFEANTGMLWTVDNSFVGHPTGLLMDQHSSPDITALPTGGFEIAFQANTHQLWTVDAGGVGHPVDNASMAPGTSPSINAWQQRTN